MGCSADILWPNKCWKPAGQRERYGRDGFRNVLWVLGDNILQSPKQQQRNLKRLVIATDAGDDPQNSYCAVAEQIREVNNRTPRPPAAFGVPVAKGQVQQSDDGLPPVAVVLVGAPTGGLETLCYQALTAKHPSVTRCVDQFFACVPPLDPPRGREKADKARLACLFAAVIRDNPTITLTHVFSGSESEQPHKPDLDAACFDGLTTALRQIWPP